MAHNTLFGAQPFEELANEEEPTSPTSLEDFYREQERKDLERRLSKKSSIRRRRGRSKSFASTTTSDRPLSQEIERPLSPIRSPKSPPLPALPEGAGTSTPPPAQQLSFQREREQAGNWYQPEHEMKTHYEIHNNIIPPIPWTNHHLRVPGSPWPPTSQPRKVSATNPPSQGTSTMMIPEKEKPSNASFNSSHSSFPKILAAQQNNVSPPAIYGPDHIDMLDPSDPWGMRWHHDGRYDVGDFTTSTRGKPTATWAGTSSPAIDIPKRPNTRGNTPNGGPPFRSAPKAPSPLSQSTSAVPLKNGSSISLDTPKQLHRRLSKRNSNQSQPMSATLGPGEGRRVSGFRALFSSSSSNQQQQNYLYAPQLERKRSKTMGSVTPTSNGSFPEKSPDEAHRPPSSTVSAPLSGQNGQRSSLNPSPTKEKRSSYLGRLVKKFSIIRHHSDPEPSPTHKQFPQKRSTTQMNGGFHSPLETEGPGHPKFASAPAHVESPISAVPEVRLTSPSVDHGDNLEGPPDRSDSPPPLTNEELRIQRPPSEGRGTPEPELGRFGGLVVTNPDGGMSEAESLSKTPRRRTKSTPAPRPHAVLDMDLPPPPPRGSFMRELGTAESSPATDYTPLRVINGPEPETDTGTIGGDVIASPVSSRSATTLPPSPEPRRSVHSTIDSTLSSATPRPASLAETRKSVHSTIESTLLSAIPSIPDLPNVSPFNPMQTLADEAMSPGSSAMETALESPQISIKLESVASPLIRMDSRSISASPAPSATSRSVVASPPPSTTIRSVMASPEPSSRSFITSPPLSATSRSIVASPPVTPKAVDSPIERPMSAQSNDTIMSVDTETTVPMVRSPPPMSPPPMSPDTPAPRPRRPVPAAPSVASSSSEFARPNPRTSSLANNARYGAYYSPDSYATLSIPSGPQSDSNPIPTPPARLPLPLLFESASREKLNNSAEKLQVEGSPDRRGDKSSERAPERKAERPPERSSERRAEKVPERHAERKVERPAERPTDRSSERPPERPVDRSSERSSDRSSDKQTQKKPDFQKVHPSVAKDSSLMANGKTSSKERRIGVPTPFARLEEMAVVKEKRNQSTSRVPEESLDVRPPKEISKSRSKDSSLENPRRSQTDISTNGDGSASRRPIMVHTNSYHLPSSRRDSDQDTENGSMRKRGNSSVGSSDSRAVAAPPSDDSRRRANSTRSRSSTAPSTNVVNGQSSAATGPPPARAESKRREKSESQDSSRHVISGGGHNWEVIEAIMMQPDSPPPTKRRPSHSRDLSSGGSGTTAKPQSNGSEFPARTSSRRGYTPDGEPIVLQSKRVASPTQDIEPTFNKGHVRERSKTYETERLQEQVQSQPTTRTRSKSRAKETQPNLNLNKPQPPRPPPTPLMEEVVLPNGSSASPSSRRESVRRVHRPTSEVVNTAELGAQEAWEHDRMTARGQSVMMPDGFVVSPPSSHRASGGSSVQMPYGAPGAGSAHTSFVVQPPFQPRNPQPSGYYYSNQGPIHNPLPAPPATILPPKSNRNRI
ncbi:hypothetical protein CPB86DRAFT_794843 [Serendipita vermifera]|nr:hypothetical protein CPB86DRAFT_794843 [Serendipita vermifera]